MKLIRNFKYKKILSLFSLQHGSPRFKAKGLAVGVFSGCFPFFGLQTFLGLFLAKIIKGNFFLAAIGTWISNPFTYVPLYYFNYKVGALLMPPPNNFIIEPKLLREELWRHGWFFSSRIILGSSIVGLIFGLASGLLLYSFYKKKS